MRTIRGRKAVQIREEYLAGVTLLQLTRRHPWSEDTLRRVLKGEHANLPPMHRTDIRRPQTRVLDAAAVAEIVAMRKAGREVADIARRFGVDFKSITYHLDKARLLEQQVKIEKQESPRKPRRETIFTWAAKWEAEFDARTA